MATDRHEKLKVAGISLLAVAATVLLIAWWAAYWFEQAVHSSFPPDAFCTPYPTSVCTPDPHGPRIAFASNRACSQHEIYVMNADGTCPVQLTDLRGSAESPRWSPSGTHILFECDNDDNLYIMNSDGSDVRKVADCGHCDCRAVWSPDGSQFVFRSRRGVAECTLHIFAMDSLRPTPLIDIPVNSSFGGSSSAVDWSPDGTRIAFSAAAPDTAQLDVYVVNADGSGLSRLTWDTAQDYLVAWTHTGTQILFLSDRDEVSDDQSSSQTLYLMDADGTNVRPLLWEVRDYPWYGVRVPGSDSQFVIEKSGRWYVIDLACLLAGTRDPDVLPHECSTLLPEPAGPEFASWPPDGKQFAYNVVDTDLYLNPSDIYVVDFDGTGLTNLTHCTADDRDPSWSP